MLVRLRMSIAIAARREADVADNPYLLVSQAGVTQALERLADEDAELAHFRFRDACGYEASTILEAFKSPRDLVTLARS